MRSARHQKRNLRRRIAAAAKSLLAAPGLIASVILGSPCLDRDARAEQIWAHFATAPEVLPDQQVLVQVILNGLEQGEHLVEVANGNVSLPPAALQALHIATSGTRPMFLKPGGEIGFTLDRASSTLQLRVPTAIIGLQRFGPDVQTPEVKLSPETWGAYVDYDVNSNGSAAFGGLADLRLVGPDLFGSFGWAYQSEQLGRRALVRLDSTLSWRRTADDLSLSAGDLLPTIDPFSESRSARLFGVEVGTDFSGTPGWSAAPVASVFGTAQAQSVLDLFLNGQRTYSTVTAGGPFSLTLPSGVGVGGASLVVTDVTGRRVIVPVEVPRVDAQLLRQGVFLWSAGAGIPRFNYGTDGATYLSDLYGYASARYGALERLTLRSHGEFGSRLAEAEIGGDAVVTPMIALHGTFAFSHSDRGSGGAGRMGVSVAGPWGLTCDFAISHSFGRYDDVVSSSGREFAAVRRLTAMLTLPSKAQLSGRLNWQASERLALSASYETSHYPGTDTVGIAGVSATYTIHGLPLFINAFRSLGGNRSTTVLAGLSFPLGAAQGAASLGSGFGDGKRSDAGRGVSGSISAAQAMGEQSGSAGWSVYGTRGPSGSFGDAEAQIRTGYGVPGIGVQSFGRTTNGYATLRGSAGVVGKHPFISDPVQNGLIIVDADRSGVPVQLNGVDRGQTASDGKLALGSVVAGVPQRVSIDAADLPLDAMPSATDGQATVRDGGATVLAFRIASSSTAASFRISFHGEAPPVGSTVISAASTAPVGKDGRAFLPAIAPGEVLRMKTPDGLTCAIQTRFDGRGGVGRRLGTLPCDDVNG